MRTGQGYRLALLAALGALLLAGCGGPAPETSGATTEAPPATATTATLTTAAIPTAGTAAPLTTTLPQTTTPPPAPSSTAPLPLPTTLPPTSTAPPGTTPSPVLVHVDRGGFSPNPVYAPPGTVVVWQSTEPRFPGCCPRCHVGHTVTDEGGAFEGLLTTTDIFAHFFRLPGTYTYYDSLHPELKGTVVIGTEAAPTAPPATSPPPTVPGSGGLTGTVILGTGVTAGGVSLWLFPARDLDHAYASALVSAAGRYSFSNIPAGSYILYVTVANGNLPVFFTPFKEALRVEAGTVTAVATIPAPGP